MIKDTAKRKRILVPFDASGYSHKAFNKAVEIAKKQNAELIIATVISAKFQSNLGFSVNLDKKTKSKEKSFADRILSKIEKTAEKKGIRIVTVLISNASVEKGILEYAKKHRIYMIVMGSHGRTGFRKLVLGSVANGIVNHASCPVLIVKK